MAYHRKVMIMFLFYSVFWCVSHAAERRVPNDYPSIGAAVSAAQAGDRIVVSNSLLTSVTLKINKSIEIVSSPQGAIIRVPNGTGVELNTGGCEVLLKGFVIDQCGGPGIQIDPGAGASVTLRLSETTIRSCGLEKAFEQTESDRVRRAGDDLRGGGLVVLSGSEHSIALDGGCLIDKNEGYGVCSVIPLHLTLQNSRVVENGAGVYVAGNGTVIAHDAEISTNTAAGLRLDVTRDLAQLVSHPFRVDITGSSIAGNRGPGIFIGVEDLDVAVDADVRLSKTNISGNSRSGIMAACSAEGHFSLAMQDCTAAKNGGRGIFCESAKATTMTLANSTISGNRELGVHITQTSEFHVAVERCRLEENRRVAFNINPIEGAGLRNPAGPGILSSSTDSSAPLRHSVDFSHTVINKNEGAIKTQEGSDWNSRFTLSDCEITSNTKFAVRILMGNVKIERTSVQGNRQVGLQLRNPADGGEIQVRDCVISNNSLSGLSLPSLSRILLERCEILSNDENGISVVPGVGSLLTMKQCVVRGNRESGLGTNSTFYMHSTQDSDDASQSLLCKRAWFMSANIVASIMDSEFADNKGGRLFPTAPGIVSLKGPEDFWSKINDIVSSNPAILSIPNLIPDLAAHDVTTETLVSLASDYDTSDTSESFFELYARSGGWEREQVESKENALRFLEQNTDSVFACRLFQSLLGLRVVDLAIPEDRLRLAKIVKEQPDSPLAAVICQQVVLSSVWCPSLSSSAKDLFSASSPREGSGAWRFATMFANAGNSRETLLNSTRSLEKELGDANRKIADAWGKNLTHLSRQNQRLDIIKYLRRCYAAAVFLRIGTLNARLGNIEHAKAFWRLASRAWLGFYPLETNTFLPDPLFLFNGLWKEYESAVRDESDGSISSILQGKDSDAIDKEVEERISFHEDCFAVLDEIERSPILTGTVNVQAERDIAVQTFLSDLVSFMNSADPTLEASARRFDSYWTALKGTVLRIIGDKKRQASALQWISDNTEDMTTSASLLSAKYHLSMAIALESKEKQALITKHLEQVGKDANTSDRVEALSRLTDLYLDFWKLPDRAIASQREISEIRKGTDEDFAAQTRIAKIYYEIKDYQRATSEIERVLSILPKEYSDASLRTLLGLTYLAETDYDNARNEFAKVINKDQGEYKEKCLYLLGYSYICEQKYGEAQKPFDDLVNLYPSGMYTEKAKSFLSKIRKQ